MPVIEPRRIAWSLLGMAAPVVMMIIGWPLVALVGILGAILLALVAMLKSGAESFQIDGLRISWRRRQE